MDASNVVHNPQRLLQLSISDPFGTPLPILSIQNSDWVLNEGFDDEDVIDYVLSDESGLFVIDQKPCNNLLLLLSRNDTKAKVLLKLIQRRFIDLNRMRGNNSYFIKKFTLNRNDDSYDVNRLLDLILFDDFDRLIDYDNELLSRIWDNVSSKIECLIHLIKIGLPLPSPCFNVRIHIIDTLLINDCIHFLPLFFVGPLIQPEFNCAKRNYFCNLSNYDKSMIRLYNLAEF